MQPLYQFSFIAVYIQDCEHYLIIVIVYLINRYRPVGGFILREVAVQRGDGPNESQRLEPLGAPGACFPRKF